MLFRILLLISMFALFFNCAGTKPQADWSGSQYFHYARQLFDDEEYYDAANEFTVVVLRYAGTAVSDSAQFYLAKSHFMMEEYLIAAVEYEKLINSMSRSPLVPEAQFELGESYFKLSPRPSLDQTYTLKAIRTFQTFIEDYPTHPLKEKAEKRIATLRDKLAEKAYENAEIYRKMRKYRAAIIYYDQVIEKYYDSSWADKAMVGKIETYIEMEDFVMARKEVEKFRAQFPQSSETETVNDLLKDIPAETETQVK